MPQIWMTYAEIADLLGCDANQACTHVAIRSLDRKKSRDSFTRVKLDQHCTALFIAKIRGANADIDRAILARGSAWQIGSGCTPSCEKVLSSR
jgi:hypothetical protein